MGKSWERVIKRERGKHANWKRERLNFGVIIVPISVLKRFKHKEKQKSF